MDRNLFRGIEFHPLVRLSIDTTGFSHVESLFGVPVDGPLEVVVVDVVMIKVQPLSAKVQVAAANMPQKF